MDINEISTEPIVLEFDKSNANWVENPEYNMAFLRSNFCYLNNQLAARRHLFVNEALDALGFPRRPEGQILGWLFPGRPRTIFELFPVNEKNLIVVRIIPDGSIWQTI